MPRGRKAKARSGTSTKVGGSSLVIAGAPVRAAYRSGLCVQSLTKALNPFPPVMRVIMAQTYIGSITAGAAASGNFTVYMNSVYEPFNTAKAFPNAVGGSNTLNNPGGFSDLLSSNGPYLNFRVVGMAARWEVLTSVGGDNLMYCIAPGDTFGGIHSSATKASQSFGAQSRIVGYGNGGKSQVQGSWSVAAVGGVSESEVIESSQWQGTYNALPNNTILLDCWYATLDGAVTAGTVTYRVSVAYDVITNTPAWTANLDDIDTKGATAAEGRGDYVSVTEPASSSCSSSSASSAAVSDAQSATRAGTPARSAGASRGLGSTSGQTRK